MEQLRLNLPLDLLQNLPRNSSSQFSCEGSNGNRFKLHITQKSGHLQLCFKENFIIDGDLIDVKTFNSAENLNDVEYNHDPEIRYQPKAKTHTKVNEISIHKMVSDDTDDSVVEEASNSEYGNSSEKTCEDVSSKIRRISFGDLSSYATDDGNYICECGHRFTSIRRFVCHLELNHGGYRPWACEKCDYSASFQSLLLRHAQKNHNNEQMNDRVRKNELCFEETVEHGPVTDKMEMESYDVTDVVEESEEDIVMCAQKSTEDAQTIEVEIEIRPPSRKRQKSSIITLDETQPADISVQHANDNDCEKNMADNKRGSSAEWPEDVDPRLRKVARNYQLSIHEYCRIENEKFQCLMCMKSFKKRTAFMTHLYESHEKCQPYFCLYCDFRTRGKSNVFVHNSYKHNTEKGMYKCVECNMKFVAKFKYEDHLDKRHNSLDIFYNCDQCESHFYSRHELRHHVKTAHAKVLYQCDQCEVSFTTAHARNLHKNVHIPGRRYKCTYCQKLYRSEQSLRIHMHSHTTVFHCQICDKNIYSYSAFMVHKNMHDPKAKKHPCSVCGKLFPTRKVRDRHVILKHSDIESKFKCDRCSKSFKLEEQLSQHMVCHSTDTPWVCDVCKKSFKRQSSLSTHLKSHGKLNIAPFICAFCQKIFPTYEELSQHLTEVEKAGLCKLCHRLFSSKPLLDQHLLSAHRETESVLKQYLTEPVGNVREIQTPGVQSEVEIGGEVFVKDAASNEVIVNKKGLPGGHVERVTIVGPSLISYDAEGRPTVVEGLKRTAIQIAPGGITGQSEH